MRRFVRNLLVVLVLPLAVACSDDDDTTTSGTSGTDGTTVTTPATVGGTPGTEITIKDFSFTPVNLRASAGDDILVRNTDSARHTFTADDGSFDSGDIEPNAEETLNMDKAGTFAYHCNIHQSMKGTITVS